jgi:hypothetical protein
LLQGNETSFGGGVESKLGVNRTCKLILKIIKFLATDVAL